MELTSVTAAPVARARQLLRRRQRAQQGLFLAEGPQAVREALGRPDTVVEVFATAEASARHPELSALARRESVLWHRCSGPVLESLSGTVTPQGVVAVCRWQPPTLAQVLDDAPQLMVLLHEVRDPGNAGTIIRVADAAGAQAVVLSTSSVDELNAKVVRSSAGSIFHVPVLSSLSSAEVIKAARDAQLLVIGADAAAGVTPADLETRGLLERPTLWVFGNEARGLPHEVREACDHCAAVPIYGAAESLNLSTAAAVCLYASAQAQHGPD